MIGYEPLLAIGLLIGVALNAYQTRALFLVFTVSAFLVLIPRILPDPNALGFQWFIILIALESSLAFFALATKTRSGIAVAAFSLFNLTFHALMMAVYLYADSHYAIAQTIYSNLVRIGEISQIIALCLYSRPIIRLAVWWTARHKENHDGSHQFIGHSG